MGERGPGRQLDLRQSHAAPDLRGQVCVRSQKLPLRFLTESSEARPSQDCGRPPLPKGEGWGEGLQTIESSLPPHPHPLRVGERESRRAVVRVRILQQAPRQKSNALSRPQPFSPSDCARLRKTRAKVQK